MVGQRQAITDNISGVTRDRQYGTGFWNGKTFTVIDTGGFVQHSDDIFESAIREQVDIAIEEASVIIFMTDVMTGITDLDAEIADKLRKSSKKVLLVVNKVDNPERQLAANEFWGLGFEETYFLSAISGSGTGEILDAVALDLSPEEEAQPDIPKIAVIGRPNVGKSSFINALMGETRHIVTDIAGTTRDSIHTRYTKFGKDFLIIDTAGMRKKRMVEENLEFYSVIRTVKAIEESDVCILMLDATSGLESQDLSILQLVLRRNKGIVVTVNLAVGMFMPPFGLNLFASHALFRTPLPTLYRGVLPFFFLYLAVLLLLTYEPAVSRQLRAAVWVGQRRWNLVLNNGVEIWLPEEDAVAALQQLAKLDGQHKLLSREFGVVDLRLPDKLYLRKRNTGEPTPGPA